ncbi:hypothetical protein OK074_5086 [Actinobacteria bacterium OK074]|nr:hypothetical protein OK074_5086 [Actinobacteria bacterium OK074]
MTPSRHPAGALPDAMAYLLPLGMPDPWQQAVSRAAQMLAPTWEVRPHPHTLHALAFTLYTVATEQNQSAQNISVTAVRAALEESGQDQDGEPVGLRRRIYAALDSSEILGADKGPGTMNDVWFALQDQDEQDWEDAFSELRPSDLRYATAALREILAELDDDAALPAPPASAGALTIPVSGTVRVLSRNSVLPITCSDCRSGRGGELQVDGPAATYVCADGHHTAHHLLEAVRVRNAAAFAAADRPSAENSPVERFLATQVAEIADQIVQRGRASGHPAFATTGSRPEPGQDFYLVTPDVQADTDPSRPLFYG